MAPMPWRVSSIRVGPNAVYPEPAVVNEAVVAVVVASVSFAVSVIV